jgi:hypothetical protein
MEGYGHPLAALLGSGVSLVIGLAAYLYTALALWAMAKRTNTPNGWLGFIPIANVYLMTQIAKLPWWWTLTVLLAIIPVVGAILMLAAFIYISWKLAENLNRPGWWSLLLLIPVVNLIIIGIMAWGQ